MLPSTSRVLNTKMCTFKEYVTKVTTGKVLQGSICSQGALTYFGDISTIPSLNVAKYEIHTL